MVPATPKVTLDELNASSCLVMKSNWRGKYWRTNVSTARRFRSSAVALPSTANANIENGNSESSA
jgi:hypothetical protein